MSSVPQSSAPQSNNPQADDRGADDRFTVTDGIAGLLAAASLLLSLIAIGFGLLLEIDPRPARLAPVAAIVAIVAGRMSARFQRLAFYAVLFAVVAWTVGMTLAVITENPII